jgi:hypothetical protein
MNREQKLMMKIDILRPRISYGNSRLRGPRHAARLAVIGGGLVLAAAGCEPADPAAMKNELRRDLVPHIDDASLLAWDPAVSVSFEEDVCSTAVPSDGSHTACTSSQCAHWVVPNATGFAKITGAAIAPGARVCLQPGRFSSLRVEDLHGTAAQPIEIINCGGLVTVGDATGNTSAGVQIVRSSHVRLSGTGAPATRYGIKVEGTQTQGIHLYSGSTDMEVEWVEVARAGFAGIMAKSDPGCNGEYARGTFTQRNTHLHHNYIHDTNKGEGFYLGHFSFYGYIDRDNCPDRTLYPHELVGVHLHHNCFERTAAEGLQLAGAVSGVEVHHNVIDQYGVAPFELFQDNGIQLGAGTTGNWYSNIIRNDPRRATGNALIVFGQGEISFFNNLLEHTGGVYLHNSIPAGTQLALLNNTFVQTRNRMIESASNLVSATIHNNILLHDPAITVPIKGGSNLVHSHNLITTNLTNVQFVSPSTGDYHLQASSPARNAGLDVSATLTADLEGQPRNDGAFDIGAHEVGAASNAVFSQNFSSSTTVGAYANPGSPSNGQLNDISAEATGGTWSIANGRLQLVRGASSTADNDAGLARWTDLAAAPSVLHVRFDIGVLGWTNSQFQNDAFCLDLGNFSSGFDYDSAGASSNVFNALCIDGAGSGAYTLNTAGGNSTPLRADGTMYRISYFLNRSGATVSYRGPDGSLRSLQPNRVAVWLDGGLRFDDVAAFAGTSSGLADFRMRWGQANNGTWMLDNLAIASTLPI